MGIDHPSIFTFILAIKGEQLQKESIIQRLTAGAAPIKQNRKAIRNQEKIRNIVLQYAKGTLFSYLRGVAHKFKY